MFFSNPHNGAIKKPLNYYDIELLHVCTHPGPGTMEPTCHADSDIRASIFQVNNRQLSTFFTINVLQTHLKLVYTNF